MIVIEKIKQLFIKREDDLIKHKKTIKPIEYPARVLIIDYDFYDYQDNFRSEFFRSEVFKDVDRNLCRFDFAQNLREASAQIQLDPPDLIVCELILPLEDLEIILEDNKKEIQQQYAKNYEQSNNISEIMSTTLNYYFERLGYGLNIFQILENLDLNYNIPVLFYSFISSYNKYHKRAKDLGAIDSIEKHCSDSDNLLVAIKKALNFEEKISSEF